MTEDVRVDVIIDAKEFTKQYAPWVKIDGITMSAGHSLAVLSGVNDVIIESVTRVPLSTLLTGQRYVNVVPIEIDGELYIPLMPLTTKTMKLIIPHFIFTDAEFQGSPLIMVYKPPFMESDNIYSPLMIYPVKYKGKMYFVVVYYWRSDDDTDKKVGAVDSVGMVLKLLPIPADTLKTFYPDLVPIGLDGYRMTTLIEYFLSGMLLTKQTHSKALIKSGFCNSHPSIELCKYTNPDSINIDSLKSIDSIHFDKTLVEVGDKLYYAFMVSSEDSNIRIVLYMKPPFTHDDVNEYNDGIPSYAQLLGILAYSFYEAGYSFNTPSHLSTAYLPPTTLVINTVDKEVFIDIGGLKRYNLDPMGLFDTTKPYNERIANFGLNMTYFGTWFGISDSELEAVTPVFMSLMAKYVSKGLLLRE